MVQSYERRRYYRHPLQIPISVSRLHPSHDHYHAEDISEGGLCFACHEHLAPGDEIQVGIPVKNHLFQVLASVAYSRKDEKTGLFRTGISFHDEKNLFRAKMAEELLAMEKFRQSLEEKTNQKITEEEAAQKWVKKHAKHFAEAFEVKPN